MNTGTPVLDFHTLMVDVLTECEAHAMVKPLIVCVASPNGSVLAMRVNGAGAESDMLAERTERKGFEPPLTIMVVDQTNYSFRFSVNRHGGYVMQQPLHKASVSDRSSTVVNPPDMTNDRPKGGAGRDF